MQVSASLTEDAGLNRPKNVSPGGKNKPETTRAAVTQNMTTSHTEGNTM